MQPGERLIVNIPGTNLRLASVVYAQGAVSASVTDERALLEWVKANRPDEVQTVERVRSSYLMLLLENAKTRGVAVTNGGEVIPGIAVNIGDPHITVTPHRDAIAHLRSTFTEPGHPELVQAVDQVIEGR